MGWRSVGRNDCPGTAVSRKLAFFWQQKKARKENCRCCDAADPRLRGCTPLRTPIRKSEGAGAKRTQYYCPFLTPPSLPPLLSREFPRTPAGGRGRPPCQRGLAALADRGIPTGLAGLPVTPADGRESLRLACARHLPLTREASLAGFARAKRLPTMWGDSPLRGEMSRSDRGVRVRRTGRAGEA